MAKLELVTGPGRRVVDAADLHTHLRIDDTTEDADLNRLSDSAQEEAEAYTWTKLLKQTWDQKFDGFDDPLHLRFPPLWSDDDSDGITSVTYTDTNGDTQTLGTGVYEVGEVDGIAVVRREYDQVWPATRSHADVVTVRFICGYDTVADIPERFKQAIRLHVGHFYRHREGEPLPQAFWRLLGPVRMCKHQPIGAA